MCDCIYAFSFKGQPLVFIFVILDLPYWASYNKLPAVFFNDGKRQNYHSMKNLMVNSQELCLMSKTHQQIWIISFKSIFLKSYIDISCILLPVESPHLGFFLVFFWVWRSKSGVNLQNHTFCALTFIDNSVQTIYTYICHPLSPQCGQYQLQT